jgi:hypothetical protein
MQKYTDILYEREKKKDLQILEMARLLGKCFGTISALNSFMKDHSDKNVRNDMANAQRRLEEYTKEFERIIEL